MASEQIDYLDYIADETSVEETSDLKRFKAKKFAELEHIGRVMIKSLNKKCAYIGGNGPYAGKVLVIAPNKYGIVVAEPITKEQFLSNYVHLTDFYESGKGPTNPALTWWRSPSRNMILGLGFYPPGVDRPPRYHNTYMGFPFEEMIPTNDDLALYEGGRNPFFNLIYEIIANRSVEKYEFVINYLAQLFQKPGVLPKIALGFHSTKEQVGKGFTLKYIGQLLGRYYTKVESFEEAFGGTWNEFLEETFLLHVDEAYRTTKPEIESKVKQIVTDEWTGIKERYYGRNQSKNFARLVATSNKSTFMPSSIESVRWAIFTVNDEYQLNRPYFNKVENWLLGNGRNVCMYELMRKDYSGVDFQHPPDTGERLAHQLSSMNSVQEFWYDLLRDEHFGGQITSFNKGADWHENEMLVPIKLLAEKHRDWCWGRSLHQSRQVTQQNFSGELAPLIGMSIKSRAGRQLGKKELEGRGVEVSTLWVYDVPKLNECKVLFARRFGRSDYRELGL